MHLMFLNGPLQNGVFSFQSRPGKAVGIRIAAALNAILGTEPVPHLWNTVRLEGDLLHRRSSVTADIPRLQFEADLIAAKYPSGSLPVAGIVADADAEVAQLALEMIESRLHAGLLRIKREAVQTCWTCGHMIGVGAHACKACGGLQIRAQTSLHLVAEMAQGTLVLDRSDIHASHRRQPLHLRGTAGNVPPRLILSRTRNHGVDLAPIGLEGLVLDPRVGLHVAVLAVARRSQAEVAVMTTTQNAASHIAAHGRLFREHGITRLQYALHGHAPYDELPTILRTTYEMYRPTAATKVAFETWFLPLVALKEKTAIRAEQLPALFKYFARAQRARPTRPDDEVVRALQKAVIDGDPDWVMNKDKLANAMLLADSRA
jgi:hypothetical protein